MLKAILRSDDGDLIVFGLCDENLRRLRAGHPIVFDNSWCGMAGRTFIFNGADDAEMARHLERHTGVRVNEHTNRTEPKNTLLDAANTKIVNDQIDQKLRSIALQLSSMKGNVITDVSFTTEYGLKIETKPALPA